ncbi:UDP-glucose:glycoprotein glucosyltransferase [Sporothrix schenckii 1099-18]|uniref:UDP-glucose:glycoprotein glucosyltransferase n=1 Tax=Sporothrix schenckii 1099-18 TaxID=1397361 RepID=A0A0F2LRD3_SPOSC|nr:UDP-glucose:glycoprotein glucosyltransferase [Sporothrix schenckii 1099-18]KJR80062.1 UDP-glucose:glycoprotein glucosyltransferase [Sporothrix schenckii 1099-18]
MGLPRLPLRLANALFATLVLQPSLTSAGPSIDVSMIAAFPSPPYLTELLETAAQENATSYFPILDRIADGYFGGAATDHDLYEKFLTLLTEDGHISDGEALSTFKLALSLRSAAPRIEAHFQFYNTAVKGSVAGDHTGCDQWILYDGAQHCSPSLDKEDSKIASHKTQVRELPFDVKQGHGPDAILYADITSPEFGPFHKLLSEKSRAGEVTYRLRHVRAAAETTADERLPVNGYGVELALKRTDYIVIDDREADGANADAKKKPPVAAEVLLDGEADVTDLKALSKSELAELGLKTADYIIHSENPFDSLLKITQDFPKYSSSIAAHNFSKEFVEEHRGNRAVLVPAGANVLWMNGVQMIERQIQPLALVDTVRRERTMINGVRELGLTGKEIVDVIGHEAVAASRAEAVPPRFDYRDEIEDGRVIIWLNNLEKDSRYSDFPKGLRRLLQGGMPGQLPQVARDIFNQVYAVDFSNLEDVRLVVAQILEFVRRRLPIRFGLVPLVSTPASVKQAKVVYHMLETYGLGALSAYLTQSLADKKTSSPDAKAFKVAVKDRDLREDATALAFADIFRHEEYDKQIELARHWAHRLGADSEVPPIFVDGVVIPRDENWVATMSTKISSHLRSVQEAVYFGKVEEDAWVAGYFLEGALTRRNAYIFPENEKSLQVVNVHKLHTDHADLFEEIPVIEASEESTKETWAVLTAVLDLDTEDGTKLLYSALQFRVNNPGIRLDIVYNPAKTGSSHDLNSVLKSNLDKATDTASWKDLKTLLATEEPATAEYVAALERFRETAAVHSGTNVLILNGRVLGPIANADAFGEEDFLTFLEFEQAERILPVYMAVEDLNLTAKVSSPLAAAKLTSVTALSTISDLPEGIFESAPTLRISSFNLWNTTHTSFEVGDASTATIHFNAVLDPASEIGQRWGPILKVLSSLEGVYMRVFLNPREWLDELPVKRFYRSVLEPTPLFDDAGKVKGLGAKFNGLPSEALLNLGMEVPPAWLVAPKVSVHDLDNIKLSSVKSDVEATYELEHILIEGHSQERSGQAPRGAQLILGTEKDEHFADTIIMANLGYFQFKANPGYYNIKIKEGRSADIYSIESVGSKGIVPTPGDEGTDVALMNFQGTTLYPRLVRKPGMEKEEILNEEGSPSAQGGAMEYVAKGLKFAEGILGKGKDGDKALAASEAQADINIFSVASGHLYERMLNIMMVSVMRHTNHTVKFWFIEQFLSPSFKDFIPTLAEAYGFQYEMVTYKWPHWLRQQKEKQREIWGYKILFLDVLFPLSLDKVIFVDADQIVRTDMYDLVQLDLQGAPYGFTPMCDSRTEMEGFRFWKQGYWNNYLRGQPYHISALYVVDLRRFRELAAGDRLRQTYHTLSADPHSLANLDQDLPNHMQFNIPIFSLPQDWLWCETWCSDEALKTAKTIDLCNNPQTKEPKLDRARRQVPEWTVYDDEIAALDKRRRQGGSPASDTAPPPVRVGGDGVASQQKPLGDGREEAKEETKAHDRDEL